LFPLPQAIVVRKAVAVKVVRSDIRLVTFSLLE
jgi:hypothetical protein